MKIRTKMLWFLIIAAGVSSLFSIYYSIDFLSTKYENTAKEDLLRLKGQAEGIFFGYLGELSRKGLFISELNEIAGNINEPDEITTSLELKVFFLSSINAKVVDLDNRIIVDVRNSTESYINSNTLSYEPFFRRRRDSLLRKTGVVNLNGNICFVSISPIMNQNTFEKVGDLVLELPLDSEFTDQIRNMLRAEVLLFSDETGIGTTMLDDNGERYFPDAFDLMNAEKHIILDGDEYLIGSFKINDFQDKEIGDFIVAYNISDILKTKNLDVRSLLLVFFTVFLIVIIVSVLIGRWLSNPLKTLSESAHSISKGDFDVKIEIKSKDEIGDLSKIFNLMAESLKKQKKDMQKMQLYLKNMIDSMPSVLIGVDRNGNVTQWNVEAEKKSGITPEKAIGKRIEDIFPQFASQLEKFKKSIREKSPQKMEKIIERVDDELRYNDIMIYPLISNGVEGAVIRMDDITTRIRIEDMMVQTEKMMSVGGLAAGMAHEINNPLGGILLGVQNILRRVSPDFKVNREKADELNLNLEDIFRYLEKQKIIYFLEVIQRSGERASDIVTNMLNFSRRSESNFTKSDIPDIIGRTVELATNDYDLKKKYDFRHIRITKEFEDEFPPIPCAENELQQVVLNLLKNAVHAISDDEREDMDPEIIIRLFREDSFGVIEVEDNGPGMDRETTKRVFEPFFTTKEIGVGTGLGLSVSYFIVTNIHQGMMYVDSTPGKGTKFIIKLPMEKK
ncbi:MAG: ATP-binding protein [Acidobacteriota bacterium]